MTAVISTTYDPKYLYFLPIVTFLWKKLGVDVICFMPVAIPYRDENMEEQLSNKHYLNVYGLQLFCKKINPKVRFEYFVAPKHKQATYAQCSRLYAGALDLPENETLVIGDVDMGIFRTDFIYPPQYDFFDIYGADLVPDGQLPMCYAVANVSTWRKWFTKGRTYQECLDAELGHEECENMRGNLWCRDQELLYKSVGEVYFPHDRSNGQNQFATLRYDRDDSYILDRLNPDTIDFHMNRPGYEEKNFDIILTILKYHYPNEDFTWLINYTNEYKKLL